MSVAVLAPPDQIRLHHAPPIDPPFEDELFPSLFQPHLHEAYFEPSPLVTAGSSQEGHSAALRFLNLCVELFNGFRSPSQMRPLLDLQHVFNLHDELADISRHLSQFRHPRSKVKVRRTQLRTCEPVPGVIEVAAVLSDGTRTWALCYRIERKDADWRCTFLRALLPPHDPIAGPHARRPTRQQPTAATQPRPPRPPKPSAPTQAAPTASPQPAAPQPAPAEPSASPQPTAPTQAVMPPQPTQAVMPPHTGRDPVPPAPPERAGSATPPAPRRAKSSRSDTKRGQPSDSAPDVSERPTPTAKKPNARRKTTG